MGKFQDYLKKACICCPAAEGGFGDGDDEDDDGPTLGLGPITYDKPPGAPKPSEHHSPPKKPANGMQDKALKIADGNGKRKSDDDSDISDSDDEPSLSHKVHSVKTSECGRVKASLTTHAPSSGIVTSGLQPLQVSKCTSCLHDNFRPIQGILQVFQGFELNLPYDIATNNRNRQPSHDQRPPAGFQHHSYEEDVRYAEQLRALKAAAPNGGRTNGGGDHHDVASDAGEAVRLCHAAQLLQEQVLPWRDPSPERPGTAGGGPMLECVSKPPPRLRRVRTDTESGRD